MKPRALTYDAQETVLQQLWDALSLDGAESEKLEKSGLLSFRAWTEFERDCCADRFELSQLPHYEAERAKLLFTRPDGFLGKDLSRRLASLKPWGDRFGERSPQNHETLRRLEDTRGRRFQRYRAAEFRSFVISTRDSPSASFADHFGSLLEETFSVNGFVIDAKRSWRAFPVVSKSICDGWDLCWSAESVRVIKDQPRPPSDELLFWTTIPLTCYVCAHGRSGEPVNSIGFRESALIVLRIGRLISGFDWAYGRVNGADQMGFCLSAYAQLYGCISKRLESPLTRLLQDAVAR